MLGQITVEQSDSDSKTLGECDDDLNMQYLDAARQVRRTSGLLVSHGHQKIKQRRHQRLQYLPSSSSSAVSVVEVYGKEKGWHDLQLSIHVCFGMLCEPPGTILASYQELIVLSVYVVVTGNLVADSQLTSFSVHCKKRMCGSIDISNSPNASNVTCQPSHRVYQPHLF
ncbi:hypothetical protein NDU88_005317 [Pleurodeles waltl]|uniref:Uncharacterized protein n=1 Tax=Pleurodeles waltl TaxID=8319 RepID=A0AAV7SLB4_PLEWA|nr:hypothetical protein NDU88_005317 [Pleurodeles waltl]